MESVILALRLILALVFGIAGVAKFLDQQGTKKAMADFGVPAPLVSSFSFLLPIAELAVVAALLVVELAWYGAIGSAVLLAAFTVGMGYQLAKGNAPDCHCFGQVKSEPVGTKTVIRNMVLLAISVFLITRGAGGQGLGITNMNLELVQLFAVVAGVVLLGGILFYLNKIIDQQSQIIRRIELMELISREGTAVERQEAGSPHDGLPIGAPLPAFDLKDVNGLVFSTASLKASGRPSLLLFVSPTCNPCKALVPQFDEWINDFGDKVNVIFVSSGKPDENREKFSTEVEKTIILQDAREFADAVYARWTPSALLVDAGGKIASPVAAGDSAISELIDKLKSGVESGSVGYITLGSEAGESGEIRIGEDLPDFSVKALDGSEISLDGIRGKRTLLTFWSPTCPHCIAMMDEIKAWDKARGQDEPELLVFSDGEEAPHRELGLRAPVVIDKGYKTAETLGMYGTPSAILVDEEGKFASELAVGAGNIWALIGKRK